MYAFCRYVCLLVRCVCFEACAFITVCIFVNLFFCMYSAQFNLLNSLRQTSKTICLPTCLSAYLSVCLPVCLSFSLCTCLFCLPLLTKCQLMFETCIAVCLSVCLCAMICLPLPNSICLSYVSLRAFV